MRASRAYRRLTSWIAILAFLLAPLMPSLGNAMGADGGSSTIEVCTAQGAKWVDERTGSAPAGAHDLNHCAYCTLHAPALGLPPAPSTVPLVPLRAQVLRQVCLAALQGRHVWLTAQPRAPPRFV